MRTDEVEDWRESRYPRGLTPREVQVLRLVAAGRGNKEIARQLGLAGNTVKNQVRLIFARLGVENRTEAAVEAVRLGLVRIERDE